MKEKKHFYLHKIGHVGNFIANIKKNSFKIKLGNKSFEKIFHETAWERKL